MLSENDRAKISDLITLYSFAWDAADADGFADLFIDDAVCVFYLNGAAEPASELRGKESMRKAAIERAGYFKKIGLVTKHFMPNSVITGVDEVTAHVKTQALITWQMLAKEAAPQPVQAGYYESVVTKSPEGWKFVSREVRLNGVFNVKEVYER
ncbi:MAG: ketosteroid isomerase-like protein [Limisphaerales bacterium]|jgi:ketosteroid isomerase-like protein